MHSWQDQRLLDFYHTNFEFTVEQMEKYLRPLELTSRDTFIDFGCGNGVLLDYAAPLVGRAVGVDVSDLQLASAATTNARHKNVELIKSNFLDVNLTDHIFTKGSARKTLHHLTDDEKYLFFEKIGKYFARDSLLIIEDAVFDFDIKDFPQKAKMIFSQAQEYYGSKWDGIKDGFCTMLAEEYPTDVNTLEKALKHGGFEVIEKRQKTCFYATIVARRIA